MRSGIIVWSVITKYIGIEMDFKGRFRPSEKIRLNNNLLPAQNMFILLVSQLLYYI